MTESHLFTCYNTLFEKVSGLVGGQLAFALAKGHRQNRSDEVLADYIREAQECIDALWAVADELENRIDGPFGKDQIRELQQRLDYARQGNISMGPSPRPPASE